MFYYIFFTSAFILICVVIFSSYLSAQKKIRKYKDCYESMKKYGIKFMDGSYYGRAIMLLNQPLEEFGGKGKINNRKIFINYFISKNENVEKFVWVNLELEIKETNPIRFFVKDLSFDVRFIIPFVDRKKIDFYTEMKDDLWFEPTQNKEITVKIIDYFKKLKNAEIIGFKMWNKEILFSLKLENEIMEGDINSIVEFSTSLIDFLRTLRESVVPVSMK